jgi:GNAT superfamily N-acetyltransferase
LEGAPKQASGLRGMNMVEYRENPTINEQELGALFALAWGSEKEKYQEVLAHSLLYIVAYDANHLVGFVNVAWDGGSHGFILDTSVAPAFRRKGIGTELVKKAADAATRVGVEWLHVDYEPHLEDFYTKAGFVPTCAGIQRL